ncbi:MAG TPA: ABC transporter substrate-binding protein [Actinomycetota bacterium]|nr:ABC transporter substrate-binding protein [Actinomycetota bacterium]
MRRNRSTKLLAVLLGIMLFGAACGSGGGGEGGEGGGGVDVEDIPDFEDITAGGTLTMAGTSDVDYMDPQAGYYVISGALHRGVSRTLVTYKGTKDQNDQNTLVPDLATDTGTSNEDASEWTFTLKDGIKWGPALGGEDIPGVTGEEITSEDIKYGIERIFIPSVGAQYPFYYDIIEGADEFSKGDADEITGIETPDDKTIIFKLEEPAGDWPYRVAMPATTPVPQRYAEQFDKKKDSDYDNHVVASGPYFIEEWKTEERITFARNEHWSAETDEVRHAYADRVEVRIGFDPNIAVKKIQDGEFTIGWPDAQPTEALLEKTVTDPTLSKQYVEGPSGCTRYIYMNTTEKPFDDPLVRQAVNYAIDRANLKRLQGGEVTGDIATSIIPPGLNGHLATSEFDPFPSENLAGDMDKAKELMAEAGFADGYDEEIFVVGSSTPPHDKYFESVRSDLEELGFTNIKEKLPEFPFQYSQFYGIPAKNVDIGISAGWCKDYNDAFTFFDPLFHGENILESGNSNYAETDDPALNDAIDAAARLTDPEERDSAWSDVNKQASELGVWVPWSWDSDIVVFSEHAVGAYYHTFYNAIDWVNVGILDAE